MIALPFDNQTLATFVGGQIVIQWDGRKTVGEIKSISLEGKSNLTVETIWTAEERAEGQWHVVEPEGGRWNSKEAKYFYTPVDCLGHGGGFSLDSVQKQRHVYIHRLRDAPVQRESVIGL